MGKFFSKNNHSGFSLVEVLIGGFLLGLLGLGAAELTKNTLRSSRGGEKLQEIQSLKNEIGIFVNFLEAKENANPGSTPCKDAFTGPNGAQMVNFNTTTPQNVQFRLPGKPTPLRAQSPLGSLYLTNVSLLRKDTTGNTRINLGTDGDGNTKFLTIADFRIQGNREHPGRTPSSIGNQQFETSLPLMFTTLRASGANTESIEDCKSYNPNGMNIQQVCEALDLTYDPETQKCLGMPDSPPRKINFAGSWAQHYLRVRFFKQGSLVKAWIQDDEWGSHAPTRRHIIDLPECTRERGCEMTINARGGDGSATFTACIPPNGARFMAKKIYDNKDSGVGGNNLAMDIDCNHDDDPYSGIISIKQGSAFDCEDYSIYQQIPFSAAP